MALDFPKQFFQKHHMTKLIKDIFIRVNQIPRLINKPFHLVEQMIVFGILESLRLFARAEEATDPTKREFTKGENFRRLIVNQFPEVKDDGLIFV